MYIYMYIYICMYIYMYLKDPKDSKKTLYIMAISGHILRYQAWPGALLETGIAPIAPFSSAATDEGAESLAERDRFRRISFSTHCSTAL